MAALFNIGWRSAETADQKQAHAAFRACEVLARIHRAQNAIARHLPVERGDQAVEPALANFPIHVFFGHCDNSN